MQRGIAARDRFTAQSGEDEKKRDDRTHRNMTRTAATSTFDHSKPTGGRKETKEKESKDGQSRRPTQQTQHERTTTMCKHEYVAIKITNSSGPPDRTKALRYTERHRSFVESSNVGESLPPPLGVTCQVSKTIQTDRSNATT